MGNNSSSSEVAIVENSGNLRNLEGKWHSIFKWTARIWVFYQIAYAAGWINFTGQAHRALHLLFAVIVIFLLYPSKKNDTGRIGVLDLIWIALGVAATAYYFYLNQFLPEVILQRSGLIYLEETILGVIAIVVVLEGTRRVLGLIIPIIAVITILYAYFSGYIPGFFGTSGYSIGRIINHIYITGSSIWSLILGVASNEVFIFILFASIFLFSGTGETITQVAMGLFGGRKGGPAKVSVVASGFFGMLSGAAVANIMTTGSFTIPLMKKTGYKPSFAGAIEACASTGGMFTPPFMGAAAFVMAQFLGVSYGTVVIAAAIPALLFYLSVYFAVDAQAKIEGLSGVPREELPNAWEAIYKKWYNFLPLILLIVLLVAFHYPASRAALYGVGMMLVIYLITNRHKLEVNKIIITLEKTAQAAVSVTSVSACIGIVVGMIELTGLGIKLSRMLVDFSGGNLTVLLILSMLASMILGLGLTPVACYITLIILVAPSLIEMGVAPLAAHFFVLLFGIMAMITPPVAISAYAAASLAGSDMFQTGINAFKIAMPFYIVPYMFVYDINLLGQGDVLSILYSLLVSIVGVWSFSNAIFGWIINRAAIWERAIMLIGAILTINTSFITDIYGFLLISVAIILNYLRSQKHKKIAIET